MALKRATYTQPSRQAAGIDEQEDVGVAPKRWAQAWVEPPLVQILVVVANIQMRTLKTELEKGSM